MQGTPSKHNNHLIIVDDPAVYQALLNHKRFKGHTVPVGAAYSTCHQIHHPHGTAYLLFQAPENAHLFLWLALAVLAKTISFDRVIALGKGISLDGSLSHGDIVPISEARVCQYPALYENRDPYDLEKKQANDFDSYRIRNQLSSPTLARLKLPFAISGHCKHPVINGSLIPWASEQFDELRNRGIDVYSEIPAGVYDATATAAYAKSALLVLCIITDSLPAPIPNPVSVADLILELDDHLAL